MSSSQSTSLVMGPPVIIEYRIRYVKAEGDAGLGGFKIFRIVDTEETPASPNIQEVLDKTKINEGGDYKVWPIQKIDSSPRPVPPMLIVDYPYLQCKYVLGSRLGMMQWFIEPQPGWSDTTIEHDFYDRGFVYILDRSLSFLGYLREHHYPADRLCRKAPGHDHYWCYILISDPKTAMGAKDSFVWFTKHLICADTTLRDVFESISGRKLSDKFALQRLDWDPSLGAFREGMIYPFRDVRVWNVKFGEGWGDDIWLLPLRERYEVFGGSGSRGGEYKDA